MNRTKSITFLVQNAGSTTQLVGSTWALGRLGRLENCLFTLSIYLPKDLWWGVWYICFWLLKNLLNSATLPRMDMCSNNWDCLNRKSPVSFLSYVPSSDNMAHLFPFIAVADEALHAFPCTWCLWRAFQSTRSNHAATLHGSNRIKK